MPPVVNRHSLSGKIFDTANVIMLALLCLTILYPFWSIVLRSFSSVTQVNALGLNVWIDRWQTEGWTYVFNNSAVGRSYLNTLHRVFFGTLLALFVTFTAGYGLSKQTLPGRSFLTIVFVFTLFFQGGLIPTYLVVRRLGLIDSRWVLVLVPAVNAFMIIISRNFIMAIDKGLEESALIDGAGYWRILVQIMVPLSKPLIAVLALFAAVQHWNSWFDALIYVNDRSKRVLQLLIQDLLHELTIAQTDEFIAELMEEMQQSEELRELLQIPPQAAQAATILITIGPIIFVYPFVQKYFVKGVMLGSIKG